MTRLTGEIWGITTYFNPMGYENKLANLSLFTKAVRNQGLKLIIIELALTDNKFSIREECADKIIRIKTDTILWHKERLINIGIRYLPDRCDKVVWLDGDILFSNNSWVNETSRMLEQYKVVQPYEYAVWLSRGVTSCRDVEINTADCLPGIALAVSDNNSPPGIIECPKQAHPGFAWAARRSLLNAHGLYDRFIIGGGDLVIASGMFSDSLIWVSNSIGKLLSIHQIADVSRWANAFYHDVKGSVGYISGTVYHLWHGESLNRQYNNRYKILRDCDFDPRIDIALDSNNCWRWNSNKIQLHNCVKEYFENRKEDE